MKFRHFMDLIQISDEPASFIQGQAEFRTSRKINSYPFEFFMSRIRTQWNSNRTGWKAASEIIGKLPYLAGPINTFLFINKGEENDDSLKH